MEFTKETMRRLFKKVGAKRISDDAAIELSKILEEKTKELLVHSERLSKHSNRRTVLRRDIKMSKKAVM